MTPQPLVTVPVGTTLDEAKIKLQKHRIEKLLVVDDDGHLKGLITVKDIQKAIKFPHAAKDDLGRLRCAAAIGATGDFFERCEALVESPCRRDRDRYRTRTQRSRYRCDQKDQIEIPGGTARCRQRRDMRKAQKN